MKPTRVPAAAGSRVSLLYGVSTPSWQKFLITNPNRNREKNPQKSQQKRRESKQFCNVNQVFLEHSTTVFSSIQRRIWISFRVRSLEEEREKPQNMVAEAEVVCQQNMGVLDVKHFQNKGSDVHQIGDTDANLPPNFDRVRVTELVSAELLTSQEVRF